LRSEQYALNSTASTAFKNGIRRLLLRCVKEKERITERKNAVGNFKRKKEKRVKYKRWVNKQRERKQKRERKTRKEEHKEGNRGTKRKKRPTSPRRSHFVCVCVCVCVCARVCYIFNLEILLAIFKKFCNSRMLFNFLKPEIRRRQSDATDS
jgi:GTP-binding protein required for 40S ribosome biogenesis